MNFGSTVSGTAGGVAGGAAQAYLTMGMSTRSKVQTRCDSNTKTYIGFTTCMKTIEVTRSKAFKAGAPDRGTMAIFVDILKTKGIAGIYRGVNAVALRQITGWSSRIGISRYAENQIRAFRGKGQSEKLSFGDKISASAIGGGLSCWNQPFEVWSSLLSGRVLANASRSCESRCNP